MRQSEQTFDFPQTNKVDLLADEVVYDETQNIVSAIGNVEVTQLDRILRADQIVFQINQDVVTASGNVVLNETTGDVYFADNLELKDEMKNGFVVGLSGILADGSRFTAKDAEKIEDLKVILRKASYTPCELCKSNPDKPPIWQLKANKVTHHRDEQRISYNDATFEVYGVPTAYIPYFSHPDGTVERKSGFLTPSFGIDSNRGFIYEQKYYWDIDPGKDATFGAMLMTDQNPLLLGEYRQRFDKAEMSFDAGLTYEERNDQIAGETVTQNQELRGHLFATGLWNINQKWRAGFDIEYVSDDQYLREFDFFNEDVLENRLFVERFSDRNYFLGRFLRFQDIRISDAADQPNILPELYSKFIGKPNSLLGGRYDFELSSLNLTREGSDQDLARITTKAGWEIRFIHNIGLVSNLDFNLRGDLYRANDRDISNTANNRSTDSNSLRGFASASYEAGYPLVNQLQSSQITIEPLASITVGTNIDEDGDIPNEDSQDVFLDATNLFNSNRFPGFDRIEDETHATYGLRTGWFHNKGQRVELFLGQSYRFEIDDNPFPRGSGLSERESDFVGSITANWSEKLNLAYASSFANSNFASRRHEVDMYGSLEKLTYSVRYFYARDLEGTDLEDSREQISTFGRYHFNDRWSAYSTIRYDFAEDTQGLRQFSYGIDYQGQCVSFGIGGDRKLTSDATGDSSTTILFRIGLKNLGNFETGGFSLGDSN
ncbi:MAG: LPS assembly protein LptD [Pseudomonadota bacterium]